MCLVTSHISIHLVLLLFAVPCSFEEGDEEYPILYFLWSSGSFFGDRKPRGVGHGELIEAIASIFAIFNEVSIHSKARRAQEITI